MKIVIIGSGPGGYEAAIRGAQLGAEVTLIEKNEIGGTCLNVGCIPTKVMYKQASLIHTIKKAGAYGIDVDYKGIQPEKIFQEKKETIQHLQEGVLALIKQNSIRFVHGEAELIDNHHVSVSTPQTTQLIYADAIIIAIGSKPVMPPIPGIDHKKILNSSDLLDLKEIPDSLTIVGAGVVGTEFAGIYQTFGTEVTLIDISKNILPFLDTDVSSRLQSQLKKTGVKTLTHTRVESFESHTDGVMVHYNKKGKINTIKSQYVLMAVGRQANTIKGLTKLGIELVEHAIKVDHNYLTNVPNIYAIGDVNNINNLAHVASHQGHQAIEHIMLKKDATAAVIPSCIFTFPEIAVVGSNEKSLKAQGLDYKVNKYSFMHNGKAVTMKETFGFIKVLSVKDVIVGAQIIGPHASDLIAEASLGIQNKLTTSDYMNTIHPHPTLSETFLEAVRGLHDMAVHDITFTYNQKKAN